VTYSIKNSDNLTKDYKVILSYYRGVPIVYLDTYAPIKSKELYVEGSVAILGGQKYEDLEKMPMKIRGRGNSTWFYHEKKSFQLRFGDKTEVLGMPEDRKWLFLAEYSDKTLIRNRIAFEMGYISKLDWTPQLRFSEVVINNEYSGTYSITPQVEEGDYRVILGGIGYLFEITHQERMKSSDVYFNTSEFLINVKEPKVAYDSDEFDFVKELINEFETVLKSDHFKDITNGYRKYIDIDSFVDWYLINEITKNQDSKNWASIFFNVIPGEKIKMGPIWDFDLAFGNVNYSECEYPEGFWVKENAWYDRLFEDPEFVSKVKSRFAFFKENQDAILNKIRAHSGSLQRAQLANDARWNTIGNKVWPNPVVYNSYEEEVEHLRKWYIDRMNWLEIQFGKLYRVASVKFY